MKIGTLFTGFGGVDIGAMQAGITHAWGVEHDPDIVAVAAANGITALVGDVLTVDPRDFEPVDVLHASPPCPNFSLAKRDRGETARDIALAEAVAAFVEELRPRVFTLENVWGYRKAAGFAFIQATLNRLGYFHDVAHVNAADYGVPQARRRLWLRAVRGGLVPPLPPAEPHVGWYAALEDMLDTMPESQFAPWQLRRLPHDARLLLMMGGNASGGGKTPIFADEPVHTITAGTGAKNGLVRAFLVDWKLSCSGAKLQISQHDEPARTVVASISAMKGARAWLECGRVVRLTPRALARLQTFQDWYTLPESRYLACRGIGNAVPPLLYTRIIKHLMISV